MPFRCLWNSVISLCHSWFILLLMGTGTGLNSGCSSEAAAPPSAARRVFDEHSSSFCRVYTGGLGCRDKGWVHNWRHEDLPSIFSLKVVYCLNSLVKSESPGHPTASLTHGILIVVIPMRVVLVHYITIKLVGIPTLSLMKFLVRSRVLLCVPFISLYRLVSVKKQLRSGTGNVTQLIECLPMVHRALGSVPSTTEARSGGAYCNPSIAGQRQEDHELKGILSYVASSSNERLSQKINLNSGMWILCIYSFGVRLSHLF